jgi:hypothetical protein
MRIPIIPAQINSYTAAAIYSRVMTREIGESNETQSIWEH